MLLSKDSKKSGKGKGKKRTKKISQNSQSNKKEMTKSASNANMNNLKPVSFPFFKQQTHFFSSLSLCDIVCFDLNTFTSNVIHASFIYFLVSFREKVREENLLSGFSGFSSLTPKYATCYTSFENVFIPELFPYLTAIK